MACNFIIPVPEGIKLLVRLTPKAKREGFDGVYADPAGGERAKIAVNAPPVDGKANEALIKYVAKALRIAKSSVTLVSGATDRNKTLMIAGDSALLTQKTTEIFQ